MSGMKKSILPPTINLHNLSACNYQCGFCYAAFASAARSRIPIEELREIIRQIAVARPSDLKRARKVTFAGGEPLLSPQLAENITFARSFGLVTSLVTNGALLSDDLIRQLAPVLDWITISIDSLDPETNRRIGRATRGIALSGADYLNRIRYAQRMRIRVKINTVVNQENMREDFKSFVRKARPHRWKMLQTTRIVGENSGDFDKWGITEDAFLSFVTRHADLTNSGIVLVPETQSDVYGTYAMIGPNGCFFDNSMGCYRYSRPIVRVGIESAFSDIRFSLDRFQKRNGDYDFQNGFNRKEVTQ